MLSNNSLGVKLGFTHVLSSAYIDIDLSIILLWGLIFLLYLLFVALDSFVLLIFVLSLRLRMLLFSVPLLIFLVFAFNQIIRCKPLQYLILLIDNINQTYLLCSVTLLTTSFLIGLVPLAQILWYYRVLDHLYLLPPHLPLFLIKYRLIMEAILLIINRSIIFISLSNLLIVIIMVDFLQNYFVPLGLVFLDGSLWRCLLLGLVIVVDRPVELGGVCRHVIVRVFFAWRRGCSSGCQDFINVGVDMGLI